MDWSSIKRNFRIQSGRSRRVNEQIAAQRTKRRQAHAYKEPTPLENDMEKESSETSPKFSNRFSKSLKMVPPGRKISRSVKENEPVSKPALEQPKQLHSEPIFHDENPDDDNGESDDFDLRPPARVNKRGSIEDLSKSLFSAAHLNTILYDPDLFGRFASFLHQYCPHLAPVLFKYIEMQKAIKAAEYANAVAECVADMQESGNEHIPATHANIDFNDMSEAAFETLLSAALPAYITFGLIKVTTEIMINEITGRRTPLTEGLVTGLSEVFCLVDPNQEGSPIVYASEEFYNFTGYSRDFVIGSNCRFLQGRETKQYSVRRLRQAQQDGSELSETLLNYRRDGRPFMNILMIAPLHDNKGRVKYYIGAQVDASGLVESGKGLESFKRHLNGEQARKPRRITKQGPKHKALTKLGELSELFDLDETGIVAQRSRSNSRDRLAKNEEMASAGPKRRRVFNELSDEESEMTKINNREKGAWSLAPEGSSGKLPGIYQNYFLMRPSPSLKIVFVSPALQHEMGNLVQSPLLSHVTASKTTLDGLKDSFESETPVTAKVMFSATASGPPEGREQNESKTGDTDSKHVGRTRWLSATPLLGADDKVGVWMVVVIDSRSLGSTDKNQGDRALVDEASLSSESNPHSGLSTVKVAQSPPNTYRAELSRLSHAIDQRPTHIDIPESPLEQKSVEETQKEIDIYSVPRIIDRSNSSEHTQQQFEDIPVGASAASPSPTGHLNMNPVASYDVQNPTATIESNLAEICVHDTIQEHVQQDTQTASLPLNHTQGHPKRHSLPQSHSDFTPGKSTVNMDYLRHPGSALTTASLGPTLLGGEIRGTGANDDTDIRTPFSID